MVTGAVLAGGASRRMGRTKALVEVDGTPMAGRVAAALADAGCDPVWLVGGDPDELAALGLTVIPDRQPGAGPLGGVVAALARADGDVVVVACDLPHLTADVIGRLLDAAGTRPDVDAIVATTTAVEPACVLWRSSALPAVLAAFDGGERAVHRVIAQLRVAEVPVPADALRNMNTPDDLDR